MFDANLGFNLHPPPNGTDEHRIESLIVERVLRSSDCATIGRKPRTKAAVTVEELPDTEE
jgi:hypothetical protein